MAKYKPEFVQPEGLHFAIRPDSYHVRSCFKHGTQRRSTRHTTSQYYRIKQSTVMTHESIVDIDGKVSSCQVGASKIY